MWSGSDSPDPEMIPTVTPFVLSKPIPDPE
jgi:hypothetical protein